MFEQRICRFVFAIAVGVGFMSLAQAQPTSGLVVYYPFTGNANDVSGNGNNGTVHGASLASDRFGYSSRAYFFNGINNWIGASGSSMPTGPRTISVWYRLDGSAVHPSVLAYGGNGICGTSFMMVVDLPQRPGQYEIQSHCDVNLLSVPYPTNPVGTWHHWVAITDNGGSRFFIDGTLVASNAVVFNTPTSGTDLTLGTNVYLNGIGPYTDNTLGWMKGELDDIRIYNRALAPVEIDSLYHEGGWASTIVLTSPNSGEAWATGSTHNITWTSAFVDNVKIELSTNNGLAWSTIVASVPASGGSYSWLLPSLPANQCRIRISNVVNPLVADTSDSPFSITGLVAYYPFTGNANDVSGNGNHGVVNGATLSTDRFGNSGSSYQFDGVSSSIQIPHSPYFDFSVTRQFSFVGWINIASYQHQAIAFKGGANTPPGYFNEWAVVIEPDSTLRFKVNENETNTVYSYLQSSPSLRLNRWSQVVATWDGVTNVMKLYLDAVEVGSISDAVSQGVSLPLEQLYMGFVGDGPMDGVLDDVSIYNRALSSTEIDSLYHFGGWSHHPVAFYPFSGNPDDSSGNDNHGIVTGAVLTTDRFGNANSAYSFDGDGDYIDCGGSYLFDITRSLSIAAWIEPNNFDTDHGIVSKMGSLSEAYDLVTSADNSSPPLNHIRFNAGRPFLFSQSIDSQRWHFVAAVFDAAMMRQYIYIDGVLTDSMSTDNNSIPSNNDHLYIGAHQPLVVPYWSWDGKLDDIRIYNRPLSSAEMDSLYQIGGWPPPIAPQLVSPPDDSIGIALNPALQWTQIPNADAYRLQVSTDSGFVSLVVNDSTLIDTSFVVGGLLPLTNYYWRVAARNTAGASPFSDAWAFRTIGQPNSVALIAPSNDAVNQPTSILFRWSVPHVPTETVNGYWFELVTDTLLMTGLLRDTTLIDTTINAGSLLHSTTYYWHVKAKSIAGWGSFSSWWRFTTIIAPPATPQLASPADGSSGVSFNPTLLWGNPPNTVFYRLQVDTDPDCATPVLDDSLVAINTRNVTGLQANTTYFWRVQARNIGGSSPWSSIWSFTTAVSSTTQYDFTGGWNIVSVPLEVSDYRTEIVFSPAVSSAYSFEQASGYVRKDTLDNGVGYWIKFGSPETVPITGAFRTHDTVAVVTGWNLIGSLSSPVDTSAIQQIPTAILSTGFYGYSGSYAIADTLKPARGYWVKASAPGILILSPNVGKEMPMMKPVGEETKHPRR